MKKAVNLIFLLFISLVCSLHAQQSFDRETIEVGNIGFTITNVGTIGRPDVRNDPQGPPSLEYPLHSGIEHLFEGGLWIGAKVNGQVAVSTGSVDYPTGYTTGAGGFEFTSELGNTIKQRSSLTNSNYFSFDAISHQDLVIDFTDKNVIIPGTTTSIFDHNLPLKSDVHLETYAWNFSFADYFVILDYSITNNSTDTWDSVYLGMWTDLVVRNVNVATDGGAAFFNKGGGGYIDSCQALYAFDVNGDPGYTNSYAAMQILGAEWRGLFIHPNTKDTLTGIGLPEPKVNANFWVFRTFDGSQFGAPSNDVERYEKLSQGLNFNNPSLVQTIQSPSNRVQLISLGPLREVSPGETVKFALATVCARQLETGGTTGPTMDTEYARTELLEHLGWAKRTYNGEDRNGNGQLESAEDLNQNGILDRYILPEPPNMPKVKVIPSSKTIDIYWNDVSEFSIDPVSKKKDFEGYRLYRTNVGDDLKPDLIGASNLIAQFDKPGNAIGFNNGFNAVKLPQAVYFEDDTTAYTYHYKLDNLLNGWQYLLILTAFDEGDEDLNIPSLESSFIANSFRVWPGTETLTEQNQEYEIGVYPNPYRITAAWDGNTAQTHKLYFYNLPARCVITIYTLSGDIVAELNHDQVTYRGEDSQWFDNFGGDVSKRVFSGGEHAWDILSEGKQTITQGLYIFSVKDLDTGQLKTGRFAVLK